MARTGRSSARQVPPTPNRRMVLVAAFLCIIAAGCSSSAHRIAPDGNEIAAFLTEVEAGRIRSGSRVRVTGVVTDDDAERRLAFIADAKRAIAVDTAPGGLAAAQGARVTIEGRLEKSGSVTHLSDPVLISYLIRLGVEKKGDEYLSFPQRALFDKLGIRTMVIETDPFGNFLGQGYEVGSGRDWARLGNLFLQGGVWNGERILPEGYTKFVSTLAPAWAADNRPIYGAFFWLNRDGRYPVPRDSYYMAGAGGQTTLMIPSHDLVVVRLGHYRGESAGAAGFSKALALLIEAVPRAQNEAIRSLRNER